MISASNNIYLSLSIAIIRILIFNKSTNKKSLLVFILYYYFYKQINKNGFNTVE